MTLPRTATISLTTVFFVVAAYVSAPANAAPISYTFSGTIDSSAGINTNGTLSGFFSRGDTYTLTATANQDGPADYERTGSNFVERYWYSGHSLTLSINGETFSLSEQFVTGRTMGGNNADIIQSYGARYTGNGSAGWSSTLSSIDELEIRWYIIDDRQNNILDPLDPRWANQIDLGDWRRHHVRMVLRDRENDVINSTQLGYAQFNDSGKPVFSSVTVTESSVPTPGAMALLGFGLVGLGLRRRVA